MNKNPNTASHDAVAVNRRSFMAGTASVGVAAAGAGCAAVRDGERPAATATRVTVNGRVHQLRLEPRASLLDMLRERLELTGAKKGCDHGQCGACTVHIDGRRVASCLTLAVKADGREVTTIEGIAAADGRCIPMQQAFIDHDALQCGYCTPGQIMAAIACVREGHATRDEQIREYMSGNLCRCGAYVGIVAAIQRCCRQNAEGLSHAAAQLHRARTAAEPSERLRAAGPGARYIAGGTTLYDLMKLGVEPPAHLVDVAGLDGADAHRHTRPTELLFGALAPMSDVAENAVADGPIIRRWRSRSGRRPRSSCATWPPLAATCCSAPAAPTSAAAAVLLQQARAGLRLRGASAGWTAARRCWAAATPASRSSPATGRWR